MARYMKWHGPVCRHHREDQSEQDFEVDKVKVSNCTCAVSVRWCAAGRVGGMMHSFLQRLEGTQTHVHGTMGHPATLLKLASQASVKLATEPVQRPANLKKTRPAAAREQD